MNNSDKDKITRALLGVLLPMSNSINQLLDLVEKEKSLKEMTLEDRGLLKSLTELNVTTGKAIKIMKDNIEDENLNELIYRALSPIVDSVGIFLYLLEERIGIEHADNEKEYTRLLKTLGDDRLPVYSVENAVDFLFKGTKSLAEVVDYITSDTYSSGD